MCAKKNRASFKLYTLTTHYISYTFTYLPCLVLIFFSPNKHRNEMNHVILKCKRYKRKFRKKGNEKKKTINTTQHIRKSSLTLRRSVRLLSLSVNTYILLLHECFLLGYYSSKANEMFLTFESLA